MFNNKENIMNDLLIKIDSLNNELDELKIIESSFEIDESNYVESYDNMLDECYPELFNIPPSLILYECDNIAYHCGLSDYVDSLNLSFESEFEYEYNRINEIEEELEELEEELEEDV